MLALDMPVLNEVDRPGLVKTRLDLSLSDLRQSLGVCGVNQPFLQSQGRDLEVLNPK